MGGGTTTRSLREAMSGYDRSLDGSQFLVLIPPPGGAESAAPLLVIQHTCRTVSRGFFTR